MLVGRERELRELLGAAAAAIAGGRGWTALIGGEPGIGKTRLAAEVADRLRADGIAVAWAACRQDGDAPPYWPWAQLLKGLGRADVLDVSAGAEPEVARFLFFDAVGDALRALAPVLLVLDDLHWADGPSLRLLDALPAHLAGSSVLVLGTYRDTEPEGSGLAEVAAERRIVLGGLPADELGAAVAEATGEVIDAADARQLQHRTGGNPFFAAEVVRLLRAEGARGGASATPAVPRGVRAVLERRLDRLADPVESVLRAAAVLDAGGTSGVDAVLLGAVAGQPAAALNALLEPAVEDRLLVVDVGRHRFPHALVAETLAVRTPATQRLELHRKAAAALDVRVRAGVGDRAELAHHLLAAARLSGDPGEAKAAATSAAAAARAAMDRTAYEDAVRWLMAAVAVLPAVTDAEAAAGSGDADRGDLLCALGEAALAAGDPSGSRRAFAQAADHARRLGRPELLAAAALGMTGGPGGFEVDLADPDRVRILHEALQALPSSDSALRSLLSSRLSVALAFSGDDVRRRQAADDAVAMARAIDDPTALAAALAARCDVLAGPDHVPERRLAADEIIGCARRVGDRVRELLGRRLRLVALAEAGDWDAVDLEIEAYSRVVETVRQPGLTWYVPLWRTARAAMRGDSAAEAASAAELRRQVDRSGSRNAEMLELTQGLVRAVSAGTTLDARATFERFTRLVPESDATLGSLALLRAMSGETVVAARSLAAYLEARRATPDDSEWLPEMVQAAMAAVMIEDRPAAAVVYAAIAPYAGLFAIEGIGAGTWGCVDAHLGRLARLLGRSDDADRHFARALELDAAAGPALGTRTRRWAEEGSRPVAHPGSAPEHGAIVRDGDVWTVSFAGRTVRIRDSKGLRDILVLLARPGRDVASYELVGTPAGVGDAGWQLADRTAINAYRRRLVEVEEELTEAEVMHDPVRAEHAAQERDALIEELTSVTGLGGRSRRSGSDAERMRKAVGNRIRTAVAHVDKIHPELGRHLRVSIRTGTYCRYESDREVRWELPDP